LCLIAVFGTIVIVIGGGVDGSGSRSAGIAFAVLSTACAAVYVVVMRDLARQIDAAAALIVVLSVAFVLAGLAWALIAATALVPTSVGTLRLALYSIATGAIYYGAAFYAYIIGLERTPASTAGVYLTLIPVFVIALAWLFLSERLAHVQWLGAGMVVLAVGAMSALSLRHPRPTAL
ncbi:MAG: DMT family transporter, partial [Pseudomonadota bacterium]